MQKISLITGITGQLGSTLAEHLLTKGEKVYGLYRRSSQSLENNPNLINLRSAIEFVEGDITDQGSISRILKTIKPHSIYNAAAQSHVQTSFEQPITTTNITALGTLNILESIRESGFNSRFLQFSTSEMFGRVIETPQKETTPYYPRSPYGCAKAFASYITRNYKESYNMFACEAILFNSEGPRRGFNFVTRKITRGVASIYHKKQSFIELGNLDSQRDWSYAGNIVDGVYRIINHSEPDTFILCSGVTHSIKDFLEEAFNAASLGDYNQYIKINPRFIRPSEVDLLIGDNTKARTVLGWQPKVDFKELVKIMVDNDIEDLKEK